MTFAAAAASFPFNRGVGSLIICQCYVFLFLFRLGNSLCRRLQRGNEWTCLHIFTLCLNWAHLHRRFFLVLYFFFLLPLSLSEAMMMTDTPQDVSQRLGDGECRVKKSDVVSCRAEVHGRTDGATHVPARDLTMRQQQQLVVFSFSGSSICGSPRIFPNISLLLRVTRSLCLTSSFSLKMIKVVRALAFYIDRERERKKRGKRGEKDRMNWRGRLIDLPRGVAIISPWDGEDERDR